MAMNESMISSSMDNCWVSLRFGICFTISRNFPNFIAKSGNGFHYDED